MTGNVKRMGYAVGYQVTDVTLDSVDLTDWNAAKNASVVPAGWTAKTGGVDVTATGIFAPNVAAGTDKTILTIGTENYFSNASIADAISYKADADSTNTDKGVSLTGAESKGVKASEDGKKLVYARSNFNVSNISLGEMTWGTGRTMGTSYDFTNAAVVDASGLEFKNPEAASGSMALLSNATNLPETPTVNGASHSQGYTWSPMSGITIEAHINGNVSTGNNAVTYTTTANQADKLIFGSVAWKNSGALLVRPANITFSGAAVDTMLLPGLPLILPPVLL